jgi:hypothetical protein
MDLPEPFRPKEETYIKNNGIDGRELSAVWQHIV